jgi:photosystem II stability/assembly factor-like uncharacterized protein
LKITLLSVIIFILSVSLIGCNSSQQTKVEPVDLQGYEDTSKHNKTDNKQQEDVTVSSNESNNSNQSTNDQPDYEKFINVHNFKVYDEKQGWIYGRSLDDPNKFSLYITDDGGEQWRKVMPEGNFPIGGPDSTSVALLNPKSFWVIGSIQGDRVVYKTKDGGHTWGEYHVIRPQPKGLIGDFTFVNDSDGWITIDIKQGMSYNIRELYRTENGGINWTLISDYEINPTFPTDGLQTSPVFVDEKTGFLALYNTSSPILFETKDSGVTWLKRELSIPEKNNTSALSFHLTPPQFFNETDGIMSMIAYHQENEEAALYHYTTNNRGEKWVPHYLRSKLKGYSYLKTDFVDINNGWISVNSENLYRVASDLTQWKLISTLEDITGLKNTSQKIGHFDFVNHHVGWVKVGVEGEVRVYKTVDSGANWTRIN